MISKLNGLPVYGRLQLRMIGFDLAYIVADSGDGILQFQTADAAYQCFYAFNSLTISGDFQANVVDLLFHGRRFGLKVPHIVFCFSNLVLNGINGSLHRAHRILDRDNVLFERPYSALPPGERVFEGF